jgi:hypothetical protein
MKTIFLSFIIGTTIFTSIAQDTTKSKKIYHNEFGVDATGFVKQFLNFSQSQYPVFYTPNYYLTYRRYLKRGNIRFAIGGAFSNQVIPAGSTQDPNKYQNKSYSFDARIGWEFYTDLSKSWQVFYGIDFRPSYSYSKNDAPYWNGGYANGAEDKTQVYGVAPLLGFRFKLTSRLSLSTEASFSVNLESYSGKRYYIPETSQYPPVPDVIIPQRQKTYTNFSQPVSLILTFTI